MPDLRARPARHLSLEQCRAYEELLVVGLDIPRDGEARLADALRRRFAIATGRG
jgi:hypothetical protein